MIVKAKDKKMRRVIVGEITEALEELGVPYEVNEGWIKTSIDVIITPIEGDANDRRRSQEDSQADS